jgi:hypothetical protein
MQTNWEKLPLGKKKVEFVKWLMKKHKVRLEDAKLACYKKFYKELAARNATSIQEGK